MGSPSLEYASRELGHSLLTPRTMTNPGRWLRRLHVAISRGRHPTLGAVNEGLGTGRLRRGLVGRAGTAGLGGMNLPMAMASLLAPLSLSSVIQTIRSGSR